MKARSELSSITKIVFLCALITASSFCLADDSRGLSRLNKQPTNTNLTSGTYRALIFGNNIYKDPKKQWLPLKTAVADATSFSDILIKDYGFKDVTLIKNATRKKMLRAINQLVKKTQKQDSVLVYYAGHGWRNEQTKEAYWIPVDAEGHDDSSYISNVRIKEKLSIIGGIASHTLLISDSCFSGSLLDTRGSNFKVKDDPSLDYFKKVSSRRSVQILAAGGKEYVDDNYRNSSHSPFTYFLINELKLNNERYITLGNLALNIEELVAKNSQQTPQSGAFRQAGDEGGQFVFAKVNINLNNAKIIAQPTRPTLSGENELADWNKINTNNLEQVNQFIKKYPNGSIGTLAKLKLKELKQRIEDLFSLAEVDLNNQRFALPPGRNAMERYLSILSIDESNQKAKSSLDYLFDTTTARVKSHIHAGDQKAAQELLNHAQRIQPEKKKHILAMQQLRDQINAMNRPKAAKQTTASQKTDPESTKAKKQSKINKPKKPLPVSEDRYIPNFSF